MNILDIAGKTVKIGKTSITVKDEYGKTAGVVTNCKKYKDQSKPAQMENFGKLKNSGIWGSHVSGGLVDCVVIHDGEMYYLNNTLPIEQHEEIVAKGYPTSDAQYTERIKVAELAQAFVTVIDCKVL